MKKIAVYDSTPSHGLPGVGIKTEPQGIVEARVSCFGNVDRQGDRVIAGAFDIWLRDFYSAGRPLPIVFSHDWSSLDAHVGKALPTPNDVFTDAEGLVVRARFDLDTEPGRRVYKMLSDRRLDAWSFAYDVIDERVGEDGATELLTLRVLEAGPCLAGANDLARTLAVKHIGRREEHRGGYDDQYELEAMIQELIAAGVPAGNVAKAVSIFVGWEREPTSAPSEAARVRTELRALLSTPDIPKSETTAEFKARMLATHGDNETTRAMLNIKTEAQRHAEREAAKMSAATKRVYANVPPKSRVLVDAQLRPIA